MAERIQNQLNSVRHAKFFEDPIEVVPYRMLLNFKPLSDFAVLQAVGDEVDHFFLAARQWRHSVGILEVERFTLAQSAYEMFEVFIAGADLSPKVNRPLASAHLTEPESPHLPVR
jgi:hypothetical protein